MDNEYIMHKGGAFYSQFPPANIFFTHGEGLFLKNSCIFEKNPL